VEALTRDFRGDLLFQKRCIGDNHTCAACQNASATVMHALFDCYEVRQTWVRYGFWYRVTEAPKANIRWCHRWIAKRAVGEESAHPGSLVGDYSKRDSFQPDARDREGLVMDFLKMSKEAA